MTHTGNAINVVCAIIESDKGFLAARRSPGQSQAGLWEFPGGKMRPGETPRQALAREIREELGVEIAIRKSLVPNTHRYPGKTIRLIPFVCAIRSGAIQPKDHDAVEWLTLGNAYACDWAPADMAIVAQYVGMNRSQTGPEQRA